MAQCDLHFYTSPVTMSASKRLIWKIWQILRHFLLAIAVNVP